MGATRRERAEYVSKRNQDQHDTCEFNRHDAPPKKITFLVTRAPDRSFAANQEREVSLKTSRPQKNHCAAPSASSAGT
jgi:hypothetical protein